MNGEADTWRAELTPQASAAQGCALVITPHESALTKQLMMRCLLRLSICGSGEGIPVIPKSGHFEAYVQTNRSFLK